MASPLEEGYITSFTETGLAESSYVNADEVMVGDLLHVSVDLENPGFETAASLTAQEESFEGVVQYPLPEFKQVPELGRAMWVGGLILRNEETGLEKRFTPGNITRSVGPRPGGIEDIYTRGTLDIQLRRRQTGSAALRLILGADTSDEAA